LSRVIRPNAPPSRLLEALIEADRRFPGERKLVVCRDHGEGRELLRALALRAGGWMGWEAATLRDLAGEMALASLADRGLRPIDDIEQAALVDAALDEIVETLGAASVFRELADGVGFRRAVASAVEALRLAGVAAERLGSRDAGGTRLVELGLILQAYERGLEHRRAADSAVVLTRALQAFDDEFPLLAGRVFLAPGLGLRALTGKLVSKLRSAGAMVLRADPVFGLDAPAGLLSWVSDPGRSDAAAASAARSTPGRNGSATTRPAGSDSRTASPQLELLPLDDTARSRPHEPRPAADSMEPEGAVGAALPTPLAWLHAPADLPSSGIEPVEIRFFRAASPASEIREVLRRIVADGLRWDEVEIVASDPVTYGCALDVLATSLGIDVTYAVGLPLERSRVGRALQTFETWLEDGLPARPIWEALASGDLVAAKVEGHSSRGRLSRELRDLRIGWGRDRYVDARRRIAGEVEAGAPLSARIEAELDAAEVASRRDRRRRDLLVLDRFLSGLLAALPEAYGQGGIGAAPRLSASALARGALRFLQLFEARGEREEEALRRLVAVLESVESFSTRETSLEAALAELRGHTAIRVPAPHTKGKQPWSSAGGKLHLSNLVHGGKTGRPATFLVGLDVERTSAGRTQDPILLDADRRGLSPELPTTADRIAESVYGLAALLAGLRGSVTLSHAGWDASDGSALAPAPVLLEVLRVRERDPSLGFESSRVGAAGLDEVLGDPVSPVPSGAGRVSADDVVLGALARGPLLLEGGALVRDVYPLLAAGLAGNDARRGSSLTAFHGLIADTRILDPRENPDRAISASGLQTLAACPMRWFYRYGLKARPPEDPRYDPARWLDESQRGSLLHAVFQRFGTAYRGHQREILEPDARDLILVLTREELARWKRDVPPPSTAAFAAESEEIERSALTFLKMEQDALDQMEGEWEAFELEFGLPGTPGASLVLPGGRRLAVSGRVDRVDRLPSGRLRVIDYKTGAARYYEKKAEEPPFSGGRRIQAGVYAAVVERLLGDPVDLFEYVFPSSRGQHGRVPYSRDELDAAGPIISRLLDLVAGGLFLATDDPADCAFCDFRQVCRVTGKGDAMESPPAEWARTHGPALPEYALLRGLRLGR
jgi:ATP-dependent helicase/nuclease subunit B